MSKARNRDGKQSSPAAGRRGWGDGLVATAFLRGDEMILYSVEEVVTHHCECANCHRTVCLEKVSVIACELNIFFTSGKKKKKE